jgi:hypothetical protein
MQEQDWLKTLTFRVNALLSDFPLKELFKVYTEALRLRQWESARQYAVRFVVIGALYEMHQTAIQAASARPRKSDTGCQQLANLIGQIKLIQKGANFPPPEKLREIDNLITQNCGLIPREDGIEPVT